MPKIPCQEANWLAAPRALPQRGIRWAGRLLLLTVSLGGAFAFACTQAAAQATLAQPPTTQTPAVSGSAVQSAVAERTSQKPLASSAPQRVVGATYVALAQGLTAVFNGKEPSTLEELRALELQQSKVAKAIESVTVNVQQGSAQGSGVIITPDGYVLTAAHVAGGANRDAIIILSDGSRVQARTLGMNRDKDAGLMKIVEERSTPWPHATLGQSQDLKVGQWCIASGHPGGWNLDRGAAIRVGRVLSISKGRGESEAHTLFTDCALIGGDSGGPLFTLEGKLIGIHSRIGTDVIDNMHVPIDVFKTSWDRMARREVWGALPGFQPVIGVRGVRGENQSPMIVSVVPDGPADMAGIQAGDLVLAVDGNKIATFDELQTAVTASVPGDVIFLKIQRGEEILNLAVTVDVAGG